jgi:hypothetical protein
VRLSFRKPTGAALPTVTLSGRIRARLSPLADVTVGLRRLSHTALRRAKFVGRFIYWTYKHGSTKHAGWVCNYEGLYW